MRPTLMSAMAAIISNSVGILENPLPMVSMGIQKGDFRRQAFRPSNWREYRDHNIEKNRASLKAMGLSSNVRDWPEHHQPKWARKKFAA